MESGASQTCCVSFLPFLFPPLFYFRLAGVNADVITEDNLSDTLLVVVRVQRILGGHITATVSKLRHSAAEEVKSNKSSTLPPLSLVLNAGVNCPVIWVDVSLLSLWQFDW